MSITVTTRFGSGGMQLTPAGAGSPSLATVLRGLVDDIAGALGTDDPVTLTYTAPTGPATATYTAPTGPATATYTAPTGPATATYTAPVGPVTLTSATVSDAPISTDHNALVADVEALRTALLATNTQLAALAVDEGATRTGVGSTNTQLAALAVDEAADRTSMTSVRSKLAALAVDVDAVNTTGHNASGYTPTVVKG